MGSCEIAGKRMQSAGGNTGWMTGRFTYSRHSERQPRQWVVSCLRVCRDGAVKGKRVDLSRVATAAATRARG
jgi:hypothetical protein